MWKVYTKDGYGVALQSSVKSLQSSLRHVEVEDDSYELGVEKVHYAGHNDLVTPFNPQILNILRKGTEYDFEKEVRAYVRTEIEPQPGIHVEVNLALLIEEVVTGPGVEQWYFDLVCSVMKKCNLDDRLVRRSVLDEPPRT